MVLYYHDKVRTPLLGESRAFFCLKNGTMEDITFMRDAVARNAQDIKALSATVYELSATVKLLHENQSSLIDLLQTKVQHHTEIGHVKTSIDEIREQLKEINTRLMQIEKVHNTEEIEKKGRLNLVRAIKDYWTLFVIATLFTFFVVNFDDLKGHLLNSNNAPITQTHS